MEQDQQAFRPQSLLRKALEKIGLHNKVTSSDLIKPLVGRTLNFPGDDIDTSDPRFSWEEPSMLVTNNGEVLDVIKPLIRKGIAGGRETYYIAQQQEGDKLCVLLQFDVAARTVTYKKDRLGNDIGFFTKYEVDNGIGGIRYLPPGANDYIRADGLRRR